MEGKIKIDSPYKLHFPFSHNLQYIFISFFVLRNRILKKKFLLIVKTIHFKNLEDLLNILTLQQTKKIKITTPLFLKTNFLQLTKYFPESFHIILKCQFQTPQTSSLNKIKNLLPVIFKPCYKSKRL
jgi:hypothetical protein